MNLGHWSLTSRDNRHGAQLRQLHKARMALAAQRQHGAMRLADAYDAVVEFITTNTLVGHRQPDGSLLGASTPQQIVLASAC